MDTNKTTASSGMLEGAEYEKKLKQYYGDMLVYKSSANSKFFSALSLPSFMRDWLVMRFSNSEGVINKQEVSDYVKRVIPKKEQWNEYLVDLLHNDQTARFLAKVKIDFDAKTKTALFSLPDFEVPKKKGEAIVDSEGLKELLAMGPSHSIGKTIYKGIYEPQPKLTGVQNKTRNILVLFIFLYF